MLLIAAVASATAYTICLDTPESASIPAFTVEYVPADTVFAVAVFRPPDSCAAITSPAFIPSVSLEDTELPGASESPLESTTALLMQLRLDSPLDVGPVYRLSAGGGAAHAFTATAEPAPTPDGAPAFASLTATGGGFDPVTITAEVTPLDYPEGLSLFGLEQDGGDLLAISGGTSLANEDAFYTDGACYTPLQVFADGSIVRGEAECPSVGCASGGVVIGVSTVAAAAALGVGRRR